ncbi:glycoside hydrolase family 31 protein [Calocera viscosa TUFC12733]|uniref:Glucosidase II subunit alpha n=1 Tax=Calocera viscosa (strain TUFC12733) TaxID=1330018 RepID=A0A167GI03_CALVF|nr:glycoside hydrolase family 31 protein [Calocera viscosa TUFC12733]
MKLSLIPLALLSLFSLIPTTAAVKSHDFKTCAQSGFCRRGRALASRAAQAGADWDSPYSLLQEGLEVDSAGSTLRGRVQRSLYPHIKFSLQVDVLKDGLFRVRMDEVDGLKKRYDEAAKWSLVGEPELGSAKWEKGHKQVMAVSSTKDGEKVELQIEYSPLRISMWQGGKETITLNGRGLLHMEHFRLKEDPPAPTVEAAAEGDEQTVLEAPAPAERPSAWFEGADEDGYWSESFGGHTDSKPKGPESLSLDITFPRAQHVYGIPEHAAPLSLPTTQPPDNRYSEPYRLYNLDVFEYLADSPMALYGSIPLMHAHSKDGTVGVLFLTGAETWIDVARPEKGEGMSTHWVTESGILDLFLLPGPSPNALFKQYTALTGPSALPQLFALGYHQSRWNYISSKDVLDVQRRFDDALMPLDVTWLDVEYANQKQYFVWDKSNFPDPRAMIDGVAEAKRKMVAIVDPHLKKTPGYFVYKQAQERDVLIKKSNGQEYEGWCWPGASAYADFFHPDSWTWWRGLFRLGDGKEEVKEGEGWNDSTKDLFIWNDMNEPSVFNGPEITMPKDNIHHGGWEHRDVHNINGMLFQKQTSLALTERETPAKRPFVLSRSFYPGSQKYGAIWTGDNDGTWEHMKVGLPMMLTLGVTGMSFTGADVGGFFRNPSPEMLTRWYQVGIFATFFRGHAHIDTKRREPYLLEEPYKSVVRDALQLRYAMLPVWYTLMHEASISGTPPIRPHYVLFPKEEQGFAIDDQFYIGDAMLVKPVTDEGATETTVYLPEDQVYYYSYDEYTMYRGSASGTHITVASPLDKIPLFYRGGHIVPLRLRPRRSTPLMAHDPFTLVVALSTKRTAEGELYLDDGESFAFQEGDLVWREFKASKAGKKGLKITSQDKVPKHPTEAVYGVDLSGKYQQQNAYAKDIEGVRVERIVVLGLSAAPTNVHAVLGDERVELQFKWTKGSHAEGRKNQEGAASVLIIKDPGVSITKDWEIVVE